MKCIRCSRPLLTPAVSVPTRNGLVGYGPVCAKKAGLLNQGQRITQARKTPPRGQKVACGAHVVGDELTMDLFTEGLNA